MIKNSINSSSGGANGGALRHLFMSPWTIWIGFRYLKSKKNSRFLSFITLLSILGVGLGVTAMIVVLSVMDGFESELKKRMMSSDLHVLVQPTSATPGYDRGFVPDDTITAAQIEQFKQKSDQQILSFWRILSTEAILKAGKKVTGVILKGVTKDRLENLRKQMMDVKESEALPLQGIYLGQELAYEMGFIPGDPVTLVSPLETEGPLESVPRLKRYTIAGIYHSGLPEQELHTAFAEELAVQSFLKKAHVVSQWEIAVKDFSQASQVADQIRASDPTLKVQDWTQLNSHLFASLRLERISMFIILAFIIIVASFNIVTTLTLMVLEKKKEIAILKTMGARNAQVAAVFLSEGLLIGALGVGGGTGLGMLICWMLRRYEFITLPEIYYDRTLPVTFDVRYYILVSVCGFLIVMAACLYPSRRAARLNPLEGIRFG